MGSLRMHLSSSVAVMMVVAVVLAAMAITVTAPPAAAAPCGDGTQSFSGGSGQPADPFLISTETDLTTLRDGSTHGYYDCSYLQTTDITIVGGTWKHGIGFSGSAAGIWWAPFQGTYDGNAHSITNLTIDSGLELALNHQARELGFIGLSDRAASALRNLNLVNVTITCGSQAVHAGMLVGKTIGSLQRGSASGSIDCSPSGNLAFMGGIVGYTDGSVRNAWASGTITVNPGGLLANAVGGGIGKSDTNASVANALARVGIVNVSNVVWAGAYTGRSEGGESRNYAQDGLTAGGLALFGAAANPGGASLKSAAALQDITTFAGWSISAGVNASTIWGIDPALTGGFPFLQAYVPAGSVAGEVEEPAVPRLPIAQAFAASDERACAGVDDRGLAFNTDLSGGWHMSWEQWPNGGLGGSVCSRVLVYGGGAWHIQAG